MTARRPTQLQTCGTVKPIGKVVDDLVADLRFHRKVEKVHALGPRPYGELLMEIGEQRGCRTFIDQRLKAYAELDPKIIKALGADKFPRPPLHQVKR